MEKHHPNWNTLLLLQSHILPRNWHFHSLQQIQTWSFHLKIFPWHFRAAKSDQLAAINCAPAHLFAAIHPSIILTLPAVSWFHLWQLLVCVCVSWVCGICQCVKLTLHQSPGLGALPHFTRPPVPCALNDKYCIEPMPWDKDGGETQLEYYCLQGLPLKGNQRNCNCISICRYMTSGGCK